MKSYITTEEGKMIIVIRGDMGFDDRATFWSYIKEFQASEIDLLTIDIGGLEFIDSAGMALLLNANEQIAGLGKKITIKHPKGQVKKMFYVSRMSDIFEVIEAPEPEADSA